MERLYRFSEIRENTANLTEIKKKNKLVVVEKQNLRHQMQQLKIFPIAGNTVISLKSKTESEA